MPNILVIVLAIAGGLALWFVIGLFVARGLGRVASVAEHQREMDVLHRDVNAVTSRESEPARPSAAPGASAPSSSAPTS